MERVRQGLLKAAGPELAPDLRVKFSAGVVELSVTEPMDKAIERADEALYRAKSLGRHRTELAKPPELIVAVAASRGQVVPAVTERVTLP
jgi:PleD family two-component response regulator